MMNEDCKTKPFVMIGAAELDRVKWPEAIRRSAAEEIGKRPIFEIARKYMITDRHLLEILGEVAPRRERPLARLAYWVYRLAVKWRL